MKYIKKTFAIFIPLLFILFCAFGFLFAPNDPNHVDMAVRFASPCFVFPLGTDNMGRCLLSRLLYGGKTTLGVVLGASMVVTVLGIVFGLPLGQSKVRNNIFVTSLINAVTAMPPIAYLIIFIAAWGNGVMTMLVAITVAMLLRLIKLVKARTEVELGHAYVMCAITSGASKPHVLFIDVLPNLIRDVIHFICLSCADMILAITGFSFIGLGFGDNVIDWGMMVSDVRQFVISNPELTVYPIIAICLCAVSFNALSCEIAKGGTNHA